MTPSLPPGVTDVETCSRLVSKWAVTMSWPISLLCRYEEDGVQDPSVAREVLRLLHLQEPHRHQELHPEGARHLLRQVLRGEVRDEVHQVQQGDHPGRSDLPQRPLAPGMLHLHPLPEVRNFDIKFGIWYQGQVDLLSQVPRWAAVHLQGRQAVLCGQFSNLTSRAPPISWNEILRTALANSSLSGAQHAANRSQVSGKLKPLFLFLFLWHDFNYFLPATRAWELRGVAGIGGTRFISFEGRHWHNDCFICSSCKSSMVRTPYNLNHMNIFILASPPLSFYHSCMAVMLSALTNSGG